MKKSRVQEKLENWMSPFGRETKERKYCTGCTLNCYSICIHNPPKRKRGRPKLKASEKKEKTKVVRIPVSKEKDFKAWLTNQK